MKRSFRFIIPALALAAILCGCSCDDGKTDAMPGAVPGVSPVPSPEIEDGLVTDKDGIIEDKEQDRDNKGSAADKNNMLEESVMLSPAPSELPKAPEPEK